MSRTKKDRPYWVKLNDRSKKFRETHDHHIFGRPHLYTDKDGVTVTLYSPDYCTIDKPHNGKRYKLNDPEPEDPCSRWFYRHNQKKWYKDRATKEDIQNWVHSPIRAEERKVLHEATQSYNSLGEVDESLSITDGKAYHSPRYEF